MPWNPMHMSLISSREFVGYDLAPEMKSALIQAIGWDGLFSLYKENARSVTSMGKFKKREACISVIRAAEGSKPYRPTLPKDDKQ